MECSTCVNYDPADGYCVMRAEYVHADAVCEEHRKPRKWLFLIEAREPEENPWYKE